MTHSRFFVRVWYDGNDNVAAGEWVGLCSETLALSMQQSTWIINTSFNFTM